MGDIRTEDLLSQITEDEARRARGAPAPRRGRPQALAALLLAALAIFGWMLTRRAPDVAAPTEPEQAEGARRHLVEARDVVVAFAIRTGRLPESLDEVELGAWGIEYEKTGPRQFDLSMVIVGTRVTLRSIDDAGRFVRDGANEPALIPALQAAGEYGGDR